MPVKGRAKIRHKPKITMSLYIEEDLAQIIAAKALKDRRTVSQYVTLILEKHLQETV